MPERPNPDELSPAELVQHIRSIYGYTWTELGQQLGRSEKMLRKVATGQTSGEAYRRSLTELYSTGTVTHLTPRRRAKDGHIVPVRAKAGAREKVTVPKDTTGTYEPRPARGAFTSTTTAFPEGGRQHVIEMPKTKVAKGRSAGIQELMNKIRNVAKSQARRDKRVKLNVVFDTGDGRGRVMDIGSKAGYLASDILADVRDLHGGDMTSWILSQSGERYADLDPTKAPVVKVTMTVFNAVRPKEERKEMDEAGTRRRNRPAPAPKGSRRARGRKR
jgi:hypothetical protein